MLADGRDCSKKGEPITYCKIYDEQKSIGNVLCSADCWYALARKNGMPAGDGSIVSFLEKELSDKKDL